MNQISEENQYLHLLINILIKITLLEKSKF